MPPADDLSKRAHPRATSDEALLPKLFTPAFSALLLVNLAFSFALSAFFMLPKFMAQVLGARASEIGAVTTAFGVVMVLAVPLIGRLLDGARERAVLVFGCALMACASLGFVWIDAMGPMLVVLRCLQGISLSMFVNASSLLVAELAPPRQLARALGTFAGTGMVMTAVAPALVEWIAEWRGYAPAFLLASAVAGLSVPLALRVRSRALLYTQESRMRDLVLRNSSLRMIAVLGSAGLGFGVMFAFSQPFALEVGIENVRGFFLAFAAAAAFVRVALGGMVDRVGPRRVATLSLVAYGVTLVAMVLLAPGRLGLLGGLFGLSHGLFIPAFSAFVVSDGSVHERGKLMTLFNGAFQLGNCFVVLLGVAADRYGYRAVFAATGALVLTGPLLLASWPVQAAPAEAEP
jgi:predicted MFS family arabinose efflux permease